MSIVAVNNFPQVRGELKWRRQQESQPDCDSAARSGQFGQQEPHCIKCMHKVGQTRLAAISIGLHLCYIAASLGEVYGLPCLE